MAAGRKLPPTLRALSGPFDYSGKFYEFNVIGSAFLWHQVRCMMAVLFQVGKGVLPASAVEKYLDLAQQPNRPSYTMANEEPLMLYECDFGDMEFEIEGEAKDKIVAHLERVIQMQETRTCLLEQVWQSMT
mmetsp:Transcript_3925/g.10039  ORF Transcript_3925/g.10039 Transcript_3925/m.10039 type:complete len:131 (+) Transcript_3925:563-955(+)